MAVIQNQQPDLVNGQNPGQPLQTVGTATPSTQQGSTAAPASSSSPSPQGSGRFTNIQKYINANQGGGQKIANQIGNTLQNQFGQQTGQAQDYYTKLNQGIQQGNQVAQTGQGYTQQLKDIGNQINNATTAGYDQRGAQDQNLAGIQNFVNQPNFNQFQDIQAGRGINEGLLNLQQQKAAQAANTALQGTQQAQQALSSEGGRFGLLQKQFGGNSSPNYSQGQQRLDQILLGQGNGLNNLQAQTIAQNRTNQALAKETAGGATDVNRLANQEKGLISDINTQAGANNDAYTKMLNSYIDPLNQQRTADVNSLNTSIASYNKPYNPGDATTPQSGFNADQMARLGLSDQNQGVYNVFRGNQGVGGVQNVNDIATVGKQAESAQDVANQTDVDRYKALAKIIGNDYVPQISKASDIGASYTANDAAAGTGLKERLAAAQKQFDTNANLQGESRYGDYVSNANANDLIKQGRVPVTQMVNPTTGYTLRPEDRYANGATSVYWNTQDQVTKNLYNNLQNYLNQQNYGQTIGGKRQTLFDTENAANLAKQGITPKADATPITQYDPSLNNDISKNSASLAPGTVKKQV